MTSMAWGEPFVRAVLVSAAGILKAVSIAVGSAVWLWRCRISLAALSIRILTQTDLPGKLGWNFLGIAIATSRKSSFDRFFAQKHIFENEKGKAEGEIAHGTIADHQIRNPDGFDQLFHNVNGEQRQGQHIIAIITAHDGAARAHATTPNVIVQSCAVANILLLAEAAYFARAE